MGLFGIFAHGMPAFKMEKALIGLVACESERHTADNIEKWTEDALKAVGLTAPSLLGTADGGNALATANQKLLQSSDLTRLDIEHDSIDPGDIIFKKVSDNGANIKCAWDDDALWAPCVDHTIELSTIPFTHREEEEWCSQFNLQR